MKNVRYLLIICFYFMLYLLIGLTISFINALNLIHKQLSDNYGLLYP